MRTQIPIIIITSVIVVGAVVRFTCLSSATSKALTSLPTTYTKAMFRKAIEEEGTAAYLALFTIVDMHNGNSRQVCTSADFLKGAISKELDIKHSQDNLTKEAIIRRVEVEHDLILSNQERVYRFSKKAALDNVTPLYSEDILREVRDYLSVYTNTELRDNQMIRRLYSSPLFKNKKGNLYRAYTDALPHVLLERGILCRYDSYNGQLYVLRFN